jgi:hypothetical protein
VYSCLLFFSDESLRADNVQFVGASGLPRSQQLRDTTGPRFQISTQSGGLTVSWGDPKRPGRLILQLFIPKLTGGYEIREHRAAKSQADHLD